MSMLFESSRPAQTKKRLGAILAAFCLAAGLGGYAAAAESLVAKGAKLVKLGDGYKFTEGPAVDKEGNVFFTDIPNNKIMKWDVLHEQMEDFREDSGGANGLFFGRDGKLYACEGANGRVAELSDDGFGSEAVAEEFEGKPFNKPNDLWVDPKGGIYFTDPNYGGKPLKQSGEHVYYILPDRSKVIRVADDFQRPNGIVGTPDGKMLYITDRTGKKTFRYSIKADGTLADKKLFAEIGSDGMTLDEHGNLYVTTDAVRIFSPEGKEIGVIKTPKGPSNVCFGGLDRRTLFITSKDALYSIKMKVGEVGSRGFVAHDGVFEITIRSVKERLAYDITEFSVKAGQKTRILFLNNDFPPHNLMVVKPGTADKVAAAAIALGEKGFDNGFNPGGPDILHSTKMIDNAEKEVLTFDAPKEPGKYQFVCTFPGHGQMMRGVIHVTK